jgi:hypothetical protein
MNNKLQLFQTQQVRSVWSESEDKWYFSIQDIVAILTDSLDVKQYIKRMLSRDAQLSLNWGTICTLVEMQAADGKKRKIQSADTNGILRIIQSIPSPKAEPFKQWLALVGSERIDETFDPEISIDRAIQNYRRLGYSENWINQRMKSIEVRKALTDEWDKSGVRQGREYADLTDLMSKTWSGLTTREYKKFKGLTKESLRDNMTNTELVLNMLAEVAATDISIQRQPSTFGQSAVIAKEGAMAAKVARRQIEKSTGNSAISPLNAKKVLSVDNHKPSVK